MTARRTPAIVFLPLMAPYGIAAGFVSVTLAWRLQAAGLSAGTIAGLVALSIWPNTWKVLRAPLVDTTFELKRWHAIGTVLTAASLVSLGLLSPTLTNYHWLAALIVISTVTSTFQAMAGDAMMAHVIEDDRRGIASGWAQAANLGGVGLGGGLALYLCQHVAAFWVPGAAVGLLCLLCLLALPLVALNERVEQRLRLAVEMKGHRARAKASPAIAAGGAGDHPDAVADRLGRRAKFVGRDRRGLARKRGSSGVGQRRGGRRCEPDRCVDRRLAMRSDRSTPRLLPVRRCCCHRSRRDGAAAEDARRLHRDDARLCFRSWRLLRRLFGSCAGSDRARGGRNQVQLLAAANNVPIALVTTWDGRLHDWMGANGMLAGEVAFCIVGIALFSIVLVASRQLEIRKSMGTV